MGGYQVKMDQATRARVAEEIARLEEAAEQRRQRAELRGARVGGMKINPRDNPAPGAFDPLLCRDCRHKRERVSLRPYAAGFCDCACHEGVPRVHP